MNYLNKIKRLILIYIWSSSSIKPLINNYLELSKHKLIKKNKLVLGVYDYGSYENPYSIGDFLFYIFFYKCFTIYKKKIELIIICDNKKKFNTFQKKTLKLHLKLTKIFLSKYLHKVSVCDWKAFKKKNFQNYYIPYQDDVFKRKDLRLNLVSMFNKMIINTSHRFMNDYLINKNSFDEFKKKTPKNYITWHIRHNPKWAVHRNINKLEFIEIYNILRKKIKSTPIIIISDNLGCAFAKSLAKKNNLNLFFCKDFSKSLFSDFFLIMHSKLFITFKAGGMLVIPWFSKLNFIWGGTIGYKNQYASGRSLSFTKLHFRHTKNQCWINSNSFGFFKHKVEKMNFKRFGL